MLTGCIPLLGEDVSDDGSASQYKQYPACEMGMHSQCAALREGEAPSVCTLVSEDPEAPEYRCLPGDGSAAQIVFKDASELRAELAPPPLHPVAIEAGIVDEQEVILKEINDINQREDQSEWKMGATMRYVELTARFALPLLAKEKEATARFEQELAYAARERYEPYFEDIAERMMQQYHAQQKHDAFLQPVVSSLEEQSTNGSRLQQCADAFEMDAINIGSAELQRCSDFFTRLLPRLQNINAKRGYFELGVLDHLYESAFWLRERTSRLEDDYSIPNTQTALYAHLRQLAAEVLAVYHTIIDSELAGANMYPHLRMHVSQDIPRSPDEGAMTQPTIWSLGMWAEIAVSAVDYNGHPKSVRVSWFKKALADVIAQLKLNNAEAAKLVTPIYTDVPETMEKAWKLSYIIEQSGLLSVFGGYDEEGNPKGFQRIHDELIAEARAKEFAAPWAGLISAGACIGATWYLGPTAFPALFACGLATGVGIYQYMRLATLSAAMNTFAYVGMDDALVPPREAKRLSALTSLTGTLVVIDVLFFAIDVGTKLSEVYDAAKAAGLLDEGVDLGRIRRALNDHVRSILRSGDIPVAYARETDLLLRDTKLRQFVMEWEQSKVPFYFEQIPNSAEILAEGIWKSAGELSGTQVRDIFTNARAELNVVEYLDEAANYDNIDHFEAASALLDRHGIANIHTATNLGDGVFVSVPRRLPSDLSVELIVDGNERLLITGYYAHPDIHMQYWDALAEILNELVDIKRSGARDLDRIYDLLADYTLIATGFDPYLSLNFGLFYQINLQAHQLFGLPLQYTYALDHLMWASLDVDTGRQIYRAWATNPDFLEDVKNTPVLFSRYSQ
ncbi:MAG: hypothetical protein IPJ88_04955 [Myxococcales bacterium]|nr:MAG: hypothetical protein IPJ88_04955 [Myxococcales bacterium]